MSIFSTWNCLGETWSLALREEHRLRVIESKMLRRMSEAGRRK
jgi:hypothetical protein